MSEPRTLTHRLRHHVHALAGEIGERNLWQYDNLNRAAEYVESCLAGSGLTVRRHEYRADGRAVRNVEGAIEAADNAGSLIVGAHYDTVRGSPGADDNATGVAALLEVAAACTGRRFRHTLRFVAFVNEEPPFFQTGSMGSLVYARMLRERGESVAGMLSLETIGCYSSVPGSQTYPFPLGFAYESTGDFVAFVSNPRSRAFLRRLGTAFARATVFPFKSLALPAVVPGVAWSDQWAFCQCRYPAVMITDTAPYRYEHYHSATDTPDRIDYARLTHLVAALSLIVAELAEPVPSGSSDRQPLGR